MYACIVKANSLFLALDHQKKQYLYANNILCTIIISQSEELVGLRSSHDRRLERMKALELNYKLLLKQLKTYETER